ncbi:lysosome-associated membrane glycoprotein 3 [Lacerta agilis]|uniref:lysosome-associated membrane glycoprotein 3 n=1 Tax=Lacerta agilis TaxID=80427 RepID=UPI0014197985|nr:lysosome-associated membrane glycoprotein 3 [Lacerta agilis]
MSWEKNLFVELLLVAAGAILSCSGEVQVEATPQPISVMQRDNQTITTLLYSHSEVSVTQIGKQSVQEVTQRTQSVPALPEDAKMVKAESIPPAKQVSAHKQANTAATPPETAANPTRPTSQAASSRVTKTTVAARSTAVQSETQTDEAGIHRASQPAAPNSWNTAAPALPAKAAYAKKNVAGTSDECIIQCVPAATPRANSTAHRKMPSGHKVTVPEPTAPVGPTLTPKPSPAATGAYSVSNGTAECIKASAGLTMIAKNGKTNNLEYFNINPNATSTIGMCGAWLSTLKISFEGGFIRFTFTKSGEVYYVSLIEASLTVPSEGVLYSGIKSDQLFSVSLGNCFKCLSMQTIELSNNLQLLLSSSQLQAFNIVGNQFGKEEECALDRNKRLIPVTVGLSLAGLFVIVFATCAIYRKKHTSSYERI